VSPLPRTYVDTEVELRLVVPEAGTVPLRVALRYGIDDPFAVTAAFAGDGLTIEWVFARDLLVGGLEQPCGEGDVHVWPSWGGGRDLVLLSLSSPDGQAVLEADASDLRAFLDRTLDLVPAGSESEHVDVDSELATLFS
jgi:hypothetical protein